MKKLSLALTLMILGHLVTAQVNPAEGLADTEEAIADSIFHEKVKSGWTFGALPTISFDSDIGFQYGALVNFYKYDSTRYPSYDHSIYAEWSQTTKGSGIMRLAYDSKQLIKGIRVTSDIAYLTEKAIDFYGFNGYKVAFNPEWVNDNDPAYITRLFYRHERKMFRFMADFQGKILGDKFLWYAGINLFNVKVGSVDINRLNKNKPADKILPDTAGLYDKYVEWGILNPDENTGGKTNYLSAGLVYDSRDNESNPMKGIWTEAVLRAAPSFLGNGNYGHLKLSITHRQYFTIIPRDLSFASRIGFQTTLAGEAPFYAQPLMIFSFYRGALPQGLGGGKTLRGILRNRVIGETILYGNFELRWKIVHTKLLKRNLYIALNAFLDTGRSFGNYKDEEINNIDWENFPDDDKNMYFDQSNDSFHTSAGGGIRFAMDQNFIVACDFGKAFDKRDGTSGLYIGLNYMF